MALAAVVLALSVGHARTAIATAVRVHEHPQALWVGGCRRRSRVSVRCEVQEEESAVVDGLNVITVTDFGATATLLRSRGRAYIKVTVD